jgi:hypothetical protein
MRLESVSGLFCFLRTKKKDWLQASPFSYVGVQPELRFFVRGKVKGFVQGAKAENTGEQKDDGQNAENDSHRAGNNPGEIQHSDSHSKHSANNTINSSHIFCHDNPPLEII